MAQFHFVEDYQKHVQALIKRCKTMDEAMSLAVGGGYEEVGQVEKDILIYAGLRPKMKVLDYGCGSGRLAYALPVDYDLEYYGIDIIDELLDYAAEKCPKSYKFINHSQLNVPFETESMDFICAFSLFTHLLHSESYIYIEDMKRVLKKDGILIFSFLETELNWNEFLSTVHHAKSSTLPHLNMFIEKSLVNVWCEKLDMTLIEIVNGNDTRFNGKALGQSIAIIKK